MSDQKTDFMEKSFNKVISVKQHSGDWELSSRDTQTARQRPHLLTRGDSDACHSCSGSRRGTPPHLQQHLHIWGWLVTGAGTGRGRERRQMTMAKCHEEMGLLLSAGLRTSSAGLHTGLWTCPLEDVTPGPEAPEPQAPSPQLPLFHRQLPVHTQVHRPEPACQRRNHTWATEPPSKRARFLMATLLNCTIQSQQKTLL